MTFIRPAYPSDFDGLPSIPSQLRPGPRNPSPLFVYEVVKDNPEIVHSGAGLLVTALAPPPAKLLAKGAFEVFHYTGHLLWDRYTDWFPSEESSESSSSSYQQNGGSGGIQQIRVPNKIFRNIDAIPAGSRVTKASWKTVSRDHMNNPKSGYHYCKKGWLLVRVGDTNMCWKPPQKKKS